MNQFWVAILFTSLLASCVREEGKVLPSSAGATTGGTSGAVSIDDPLAPQAWHLKNTGQNSYSSGNGIAGEDIAVSDAHEQNITGKDIRIAISDSGTDFAHEDLKDNELVGEHRNYTLNSPTSWHGSLPYTVGNDAHGTAVTGLIAATKGNGLGAYGVAPDAKFAAFRYIADYNSTPSSQLARDIDQTDGNFDIFNYSYGYSQCVFASENELVLLAVKDGARNLRGGLGAIYVQAAGNDYLSDLNKCLGSSSGYFAGNTNSSEDLTIPEKIIVGAVNARGKIASYSTPGSGLWISAPGGEDGEDNPAMLTTDISGCSNGYSLVDFSLDPFNRGNVENQTCSYTSLMNGTSAATPVISGVVALMLQANAYLSWRDVKHILAMTADEVDYSLVQNVPHPMGAAKELTGYTYDKKWVQNAAGVDFSNWYGFGRVNALNAVLMATTYVSPLKDYQETVNPSTDQWYYDSGTISVNIPDNSSTGTPINTSTTLNVAHNLIIESVQIEVDITHPAPQDLAVILISPSNTHSKLLNINSRIHGTSFPSEKVLLTNAFYGENSLGNWKIKIVDGKTLDTGSLTRWKIKINGHRTASDGINPAPVTNPVMTENYPSAGSNAVTPPFSFTPSLSTDVIRHEVSVGTAPGLSNAVKWTSIRLEHSNIQLRQITLETNTRYYLNIRAIDSSENPSTVVTKAWQIGTP